MIKQDYQQFAAMWQGVHSSMAGGKDFNDNSMLFIFGVLEEYSLDNIGNAVKIHARQSKFAPMPADIVEIIADRTGAKHIGSEEAWSIALKAMDERLPAIFTNEILEAKAICQPVYDSGDKVGARMAFREAYTRLIANSEPVKWFVSQGDDKTLTNDAVQQAIKQGRLPQAMENKYLIEAPTTSSLKLIEQAGIRTGKVSAMAKLGIIKSILRGDDDNGIVTREQERQAFESKRSAIVGAAETKLQSEVAA